MRGDVLLYLLEGHVDHAGPRGRPPEWTYGLGDAPPDPFVMKDPPLRSYDGDVDVVGISLWPWCDHEFHGRFFLDGVHAGGKIHKRSVSEFSPHGGGRA